MKQINPKTNAKTLADITRNHRQLQSKVIKYLSEHFVEEVKSAEIDKVFEKASEELLCVLKQKTSQS